MARALHTHARSLFALAALAGLVHAIDEVFFVGEAYGAIPIVVLSIAVVIWWNRLDPLWWGLASVACALAWLTGIPTHWLPLAQHGASPGDWTSFISVPAGVLFLLLGVSILRTRQTRVAG